MLVEPYYYVLASLFSLAQIILLYQLVKYKKLLDQKNIQLIEHHLHTSFLHEYLTMFSKNSNKSASFEWFLTKIKTYYQLNQILIYDDQADDITLQKSAIEPEINTYLKEHIEQINKEVRNNFLIKKKLNHLEYYLYITDLPMIKLNNKLIILVSKYPCDFNQNEKISLENILNLLKITYSFI